MQVMELQESLINKLRSDYKGIENDAEYYYIVGQCISYMCNKYVHLNKMFKKDLVAKQLILSKDNTQLRDRIKTMLLGKCSNIIYLDKDKKFNNAFAMLMGYVAEDNKINRDYLDMGYCSNNVL